MQHQILVCEVALQAKWPNHYSYTVALHSVALRFPGFGGVSQENCATPPEKGPVTPTFSALKEGVALQTASWKMSRHMGVLQLHCRLPHYSGLLRLQVVGPPDQC